MLASVSHKMCSAAKASLVYNYQYQLSSYRLPPCALLSLGPVMRSAQLLKSTGAEGLGTLRFQVLPFPVEHRYASHEGVGAKWAWNHLSTLLTVPFCAVTPCRAYLDEGKYLF